MSLERIEFPYVNLLTKEAHSLFVSMEGRLVAVKPVFEALEARWDFHRVALAKHCTLHLIASLGRSGTAVDLDDLDSYLRGMLVNRSKNPMMLRHFQEHLVPTLKHKALGVAAIEAQEQKALADEKDKVIEVNHPLTPVDIFRREASVGQHRLDPEVISTTVGIGMLDLFVRPKAPAFADRAVELVRVEIEISDQTYTRNMLAQMRLGNAELLTGPEMQRKYPTHKALNRPTLPSIPFIQTVGGKPQLVTLPARLAPHRWELHKQR